MWEIFHDLKQPNPFIKDEAKNYPCVNFECEFYDKDDPDGFNCHIFYPPSKRGCENYISEDK